MWDLSSLTRDQTQIPLQWECGVLTTGPQGRLEVLFFFKKKKKGKKEKGTFRESTWRNLQRRPKK